MTFVCVRGIRTKRKKKKRADCCINEDGYCYCFNAFNTVSVVYHCIIPTHNYHYTFVHSCYRNTSAKVDFHLSLSFFIYMLLKLCCCVVSKGEPEIIYSMCSFAIKQYLACSMRLLVSLFNYKFFSVFRSLVWKKEINLHAFGDCYTKKKNK